MAITLPCLQAGSETFAMKGFAWQSTFIVCNRCQKHLQGGDLRGNHPSLFAAGVKNPCREGVFVAINLHCLQQVSETLAGRGFAWQSSFIVCNRCQKLLQGGDLLGNHPSLFTAGVKNPGREGVCVAINLHCLQQVSETLAGRGFAWHHPSLFAAGFRNSCREGVCVAINLHCLQQVSETLAGRGFAWQ
jgi:hypothetical protein